MKIGMKIGRTEIPQIRKEKKEVEKYEEKQTDRKKVILKIE